MTAWWRRLREPRRSLPERPPPPPSVLSLPDWRQAWLIGEAAEFAACLERGEVPQCLTMTTALEGTTVSYVIAPGDTGPRRTVLAPVRDEDGSVWLEPADVPRDLRELLGEGDE